MGRSIMSGLQCYLSVDVKSNIIFHINHYPKPINLKSYYLSRIYTCSIDLFLKIFDITDKKKIVWLHKNVSRLFQKKTSGFAPLLLGWIQPPYFRLITQKDQLLQIVHMGSFFDLSTLFCLKPKHFLHKNIVSLINIHVHKGNKNLM